MLIIDDIFISSPILLLRRCRHYCFIIDTTPLLLHFAAAIDCR